MGSTLRGAVPPPQATCTAWGADPGSARARCGAPRRPPATASARPRGRGPPTRRLAGTSPAAPTTRTARWGRGTASLATARRRCSCPRRCSASCSSASAAGSAAHAGARALLRCFGGSGRRLWAGQLFGGPCGIAWASLCSLVGLVRAACTRPRWEFRALYSARLGRGLQRARISHRGRVQVCTRAWLCTFVPRGGASSILNRSFFYSAPSFFVGEFLGSSVRI